MFGLLKNKISEFLGGITKRTEAHEGEKKEQLAQATRKQEQKLEEKKDLEGERPEETAVKKAEVKKETREKPREIVLEKKEIFELGLPERAEKPKAAKPDVQKEERRETRKEGKKEGQAIEEKGERVAERRERAKDTTPINPFAQTGQKELTGEKDAKERLEGLKRLEKKAEKGEEAGRIKPQVGIVSSISSMFSSNITIRENDVSDLLDSLELSLLEGDVAYEVSQEIVGMLKTRLVGSSVPKNKFSEAVRGMIKDVLVEVMVSGEGYDLFTQAEKAPKPFKILFVGPNGAGKTTTMAKLAKHFALKGKSCVFAASDTFRAAAIEQLEVHAQRLGVKVIKSQYGSDPASVAYDAIKYAQSHGIDIVLIDSSGRQDTNANLLDELKKIVRVSKPDAKIYIGESIAGNAIIQQVNAFKSAIGLDAVILTKLDCDPKGGSAISVAKATGVPICLVGVGQAYSDLKEFNPKEVADELVAS